MKEINNYPQRNIEHEDTKHFMLDQIKNVYGFDYNPEWHQDIDALGTQHDVYNREQGGALLLRRNASEEIIACARL